jgi:hypothetical protein
MDGKADGWKDNRWISEWMEGLISECKDASMNQKAKEEMAERID